MKRKEMKRKQEEKEENKIRETGRMGADGLLSEGEVGC